MNIRKIIQEEISKLFEKNIEEIAKRIESLPDTAALFVTPNNAGFELNLYDPKTKTPYGTITFIKNRLSSHYYVSGVAAEKGFGPFMYELAMMQAKKSGNLLMPSRDGDVRGGAFSVWKKFFDRSDVIKKEHDLYDDEFRFDILTGQDETYSNEEKDESWDESSDVDKKALRVFNTAYAMNPDSNYTELVSRSTKYSDKIQSRAEDAGAKLWDNAYMGDMFSEGVAMREGVVSHSDLDNLERELDDIFREVGIDVVFTKHFFDRVNDVRNKKNITTNELKSIFKRVYSKYKDDLIGFKKGFEGVFKSYKSNINIPFALAWDYKNNELDLVSKTVMRKKDFKTTSPVLPVSESEDSKYIKVYHGTMNKNVPSIKSKGLESNMGYHNAGWYMVSTDFESALFHATPEGKGSVSVVEFKVPVTNKFWEGDPYFWPPYEKDKNSSWFALKQPIPSEFIVNIQEVPYEEYAEQKKKGF